jgi:hypothetical protein
LGTPPFVLLGLLALTLAAPGAHTVFHGQGSGSYSIPDKSRQERVQSGGESSAEKAKVVSK